MKIRTAPLFGLAVAVTLAGTLFGGFAVALDPEAKRAVLPAQFANHLGSLIEAVNILGSLFYGTMLGIFLIAFYIARVGGWAAFWAA